MESRIGRVSALAVALLLPLCALIAWPVVELGVNDEWSYAKTVQVLVQTGHVVYNGWTAAIVGWMFYVGEFFVKLFGFSFTTLRLSMLPLSMVTVVLAHRTIARCGVNNWNATLGTLLLALSPLFFPLEISYMTDIPGFFCLVLCLYACVRALQAHTDNAALAWLCFAALSNAVGGMVRQIAWLGVLVMVPSAIWLLRKRPRFLAIGSAVWVVSVVIIYGLMHWYHHQLYSVPEDLIQTKVTLRALGNQIEFMIGAVLDVPSELLPLLIFFIPAANFRSRTAVRLLAVITTLLVAFSAVRAVEHRRTLVPYLGNYVTPYGILSNSPLHGPMPVVLSTPLRLLLTILLVVSIVAVVLVMRSRQRTTQETPKEIPGQDSWQRISWYQLGVLLIPITLAYFVLLLPRALNASVYDRYLLGPLFFAMIPVLRAYQELVQPRLPRLVLVPIGLYAFFAVAGTHDSFVRFRAYLAAIEELRAAGVPATEIDGGLEYDGWVQIEKAGYINDPRIPARPGDRFRPPIKDNFGACPVFWIDNFSVFNFRYGLATYPESCLGPAGYPPVSYRTWLGPRDNKIYFVRVGQDNSRAAQNQSGEQPSF